MTNQISRTRRVVMTLADGMHDKGHDLYVDRFYNSPLLAVELAKAGITVTGTVQANQKGLPATFQSKKKEPRGTLTGYRADDMLAFYWVDKRKVFMITTKHELSMVDVPPRYAQLHTHTILSLVPRLHGSRENDTLLFFLLYYTGEKECGAHSLFSCIYTGDEECGHTLHPLYIYTGDK